jgi:DNA-directed RNA polymerase specialized sigma subunit
MMLSAILSDTDNLQSNTTTDLDRQAVSDLVKKADIKDRNAYFLAMEEEFAAYRNMSEKDIFYSDYKEFTINGISYGCATVVALTPEKRQAAVVSWDGLVETGWEPVPAESVEHQVLAKIEYEEIRARMDAEDKKIAQAFEAKELLGDSVRKIAQDLGVSEPRVYQLIARAKAIGKEYRKENSNE